MKEEDHNNTDIKIQEGKLKTKNSEYMIPECFLGQDQPFAFLKRKSIPPLMHIKVVNICPCNAMSLIKKH